MILTEEEIQEIINYEVIADCYTDEEVIMGWAVYMIDNLNYPFEAEYLVKKRSGESKWRKVKVVNNETEESSFGGNAFYVEIELDDMIIPVSLDKLRNIKGDPETMEALQVWSHKINS